jgi:hypothetical protein
MELRDPAEHEARRTRAVRVEVATAQLERMAGRPTNGVVSWPTSVNTPEFVIVPRQRSRLLFARQVLPAATVTVPHRGDAVALGWSFVVGNRPGRPFIEPNIAPPPR